MPRYSYTVSGFAAENQTWTVSGELQTANAGAFMELPERAMQDVFAKLTQGLAIFGQPGVGCRGPYRIAKLAIEELAGEDLQPRPVQSWENIGSTTRDQRARPLGEVLRDDE